MVHCFIYLVSLAFVFSSAVGGPLELKKEHTEKIGKTRLKLLLCCMPAHDNELKGVAQDVRRALERSGQFKVTCTETNELKSKKEIQELFNNGYALVGFINQAEGKTAVEWRLYDATQANMVKGKKMYKRGSSPKGWAYALADELWTELTYQPSSFSSKIAYVKRLKDRSAICITDFDGSHSRTVPVAPGTYVGLYWHHDTHTPRVLCSQFTRFNAQLVTLNLQGQKRVVVDLDGTCVGISLHPDMHQALYCKSGEIWQYIYDGAKQKSSHACIIKNEGKNTSPQLLPTGDIVFCTDAPSLGAQGPQIAYYHTKTAKTELLTKNGYCVSPAYSAGVHKIAYSKRVNGVMQLFSCTLSKRSHEQLTFDKGDKLDPSWSPCGAYIAFCRQMGKSSRIGVLHTVFKDQWLITPETDQCAYPAWSGLYPVLPE